MTELKDEIEVDNLSSNQWTISNKKWKSVVAVDEQDIENDNFGLYNVLMTNMGDAATMHKDELNFPLLANGFTQKCYTGSNFFSNGQKRSAGDAGFSNLLTVKLNSFSFQQAKANLLSRKNSKGRPMNLGNKLLLVVGTALEPVARVIVENDLLIQTVMNKDGTDIVAAANQNNVNKGAASVQVSSLLPDNVWFLLETGKPLKPVIFQVNKKPILIAQTSAAQSDHVFEKHEFRYQAYGPGHSYPSF